MSIYRTLLKLARKVGPAALMAAVRYGPELRRMVKDNPEAFAGLTRRFSKVTGAKESGSLQQRVNVLREQAAYLYASANTADVAQQAAAWRTELEAIEKAVPVLDAMSRKRRIAERRELVGRIDRLSSQILAASLIDTVEDAEIVGESDGADEGGTETEGPRTGSDAAGGRSDGGPGPGDGESGAPAEPGA